MAISAFTRVFDALWRIAPTECAIGGLRFAHPPFGPGETCCHVRKAPLLKYERTHAGYRTSAVVTWSWDRLDSPNGTLWNAGVKVIPA
jgi:hypothetical protein